MHQTQLYGIYRYLKLKPEFDFYLCDHVNSYDNDVDHDLCSQIVLHSQELTLFVTVISH
jgi:hypothetical protein